MDEAPGAGRGLGTGPGARDGLLWPAAVYVTVAVLAVAAARSAGTGIAELAQAGWLVALQPWFLPVYLMLIALTPVMLAAHRRWGLAVPVVMALGAAAVNVGVVGARVHVVGCANYLLVWGSMFVWGFAWRDGTLTRPRWRPGRTLWPPQALRPWPASLAGVPSRST